MFQDIWNISAFRGIHQRWVALQRWVAIRFRASHGIGVISVWSGLFSIFCRVFWIFCSRLHTAPWCQHQDRKPELQTGFRALIHALVWRRYILTLSLWSTWSRSVRQCLRTWRCWTMPRVSRSTMFPRICSTTNGMTSLTQTTGVEKRTTQGQQVTMSSARGLLACGHRNRRAFRLSQPLCPFIFISIHHDGCWHLANNCITIKPKFVQML